MGCLSVFDVTGIQRYLFRSSKLKENLGASLLVTQSLSDWLGKAINEKCGANTLTDWKTAGSFKMRESPPPAAEILYIGGGNAMVAFADKNQAKEVTEVFSRMLLERAPGLEIAAAHHETQFEDYCKDRKDLIGKHLLINKNSRVRSTGLMGLAVTRPCVKTGSPAVTKDDGDWVSAEILAKRKAVGTDRFDGLISDHNQFAFPKELHKLGQITGESHIAVICIDGNGMGKKLSRLLSQQSDYSGAVAAMRSFSKGVAAAYNGAVKNIVGLLENNTRQDCGSYYTSKKLLLATENGKACLPLRPIFMDGDDIVLVSDGRLGLCLAETILKKLGQQSVTINGLNLSLEACAGVAIVKSHFPFYRACRLAEELCASAKAKARVNAAATGANEMGSWLDFQIIQSGVTDSLSQLRSRHYNVAGRNPPSDLTAANHQPYARYNLCWRPWRVDGSGSDDDWSKLKATINDFKKNWPRSWAKELRSTLIKDKTAVELLLQEAASRGPRLPSFSGPASDVNPGTGFSADEITPYLDAIELFDFYIEIASQEAP